MQVTQRDIVILSLFALLLTAGGVVVVRKAQGPGRDAAEANRPAAPRTAEAEPPAGVVDAPDSAAVRSASRGDDPFASNLPAGAVLAGYEQIAERRLFTPLVNVQSRGGADTGVPEVPAVDSSLQVQAPAQSGGVFDTVGQPSSAGDEAPGPTVEASGVAAKPPVAVTGFVRTDDGYRVVVEETNTRRVRIVSVGEEAFGYRVRQVAEDDRRVTLENSAGFATAPVTVALGENKPVASAQPGQPQQPQPGEQGGEQSGGRSSGGGAGGMQYGGMGGGMPGGFDPSRLSPEQRQRYEEYMRRRGGGRDNFGRGRGGRD